MSGQAHACQDYAHHQDAAVYGQPGHFGGMSAAGGYGAVPVDASGLEAPQPGGYGAYEAKGTFLRGRRRRLNLLPMVAGVVLPWGLFAGLYAALSFSMHYEEPAVCWLLVSGCILATFGLGLYAAGGAAGRLWSNVEREPTWIIFMAVSMFIACSSAFMLGNMNYGKNMRRYYDMRNLNNYTAVSPTRMRGQQLMDAGVMEFVPEARLDVTKSMGFKNGNVYCVAPITVGDEPLATYDFWAVGSNCCSGSQANFHCENFNNPHAHGGLRLMVDNDRAFYRLAVQQAEVAYNIKAVHPLFFEWSVEPTQQVEHWKQEGRSEYLVWMLSYLLFQAFLVAVAALGFAKMGLS